MGVHLSNQEIRINQELEHLIRNVSISCPGCQWSCYKYGHDRLGRQKFKCKNKSCGYQFIPGRLLRERKAGPRISCPLCSRSMHQHKVRDGYVRYRCSGHRAQSEPRCNHKINLYQPDQELTNDPLGTELGKKLLNVPRFSWSKMRFTQETVSLALYFLLVAQEPATTVSQIMHDLYSVDVSHDQISRWAIKAASSFAKVFTGVKFNIEGERVYSDETIVKGGKKVVLRANSKPHNRWRFWENITSKTKVILGFWLSRKRDNLAARSNFACCKRNSLGEPEMFVNDGLWSYDSAFGEVYDPRRVRRFVYQDFSDKINNNLVERQHGCIKSPLKRYRGFKSDLGLFAFLVNRVILHNFFRPRMELNSLTPAEAAGFVFPKNKKHFANWL